MSSNYIGPGVAWNDGEAHLGSEEVPCKRCHGLGEDRDGADCIFCDGLGSTYLR